jgi:hypothetical protein
MNDVLAKLKLTNCAPIQGDSCGRRFCLCSSSTRVQLFAGGIESESPGAKTAPGFFHVPGLTLPGEES